MLPKSKPLLVEYFQDYFPAFILPMEFNVSELPAMWEAQRMHQKYEMVLVIGRNDCPEIHPGEPYIPVEDSSFIPPPKRAYGRRKNRLVHEMVEK